MSRTVKCINCNIVINELLSYVQNKISISDEETLVRICASNWTSEQIVESHSLLFESEKERKIDCYMIYLIFSTEPDIIPVFVARDLEKLPPITFDHLDVSKLLKDLALVQSELKLIKSSYVTIEQLEAFKQDRQNLHKSPPFSAVKINMKRGAYRDSGPIGLSMLDESAVISGVSSFNCPNDENNLAEGSSDTPAVSKTQRTAVSLAADAECDESPQQHNKPASDQRPCKQLTGGTTSSHKNESYADTVKSRTVVRKKGRKSKNRVEGKTGCCVVNPEEMFRAAERHIPLFITNVHKNTSESDITRYICKMTKETVKLEKISIRRECDYKAYKFFVARNKLSMFLDEKIWPQGIIFRRFINFKLKRNSETSDKGDGPLIVNE
ncbi:hypothetical protein ABMA27_012163 [Loxostege sticticalis]|uniref:Mutant cadherin n=1 Tax=Loxostege sticticalis TaxID=481309 RepID=A0ABR3IIW5_LOXSC